MSPHPSNWDPTPQAGVRLSEPGTQAATRCGPALAFCGPKQRQPPAQPEAVPCLIRGARGGRLCVGGGTGPTPLLQSQGGDAGPASVGLASARTDGDATWRQRRGHGAARPTLTWGRSAPLGACPWALSLRLGLSRPWGFSSPQAPAWGWGEGPSRGNMASTPFQSPPRSGHGPRGGKGHMGPAPEP